MKTKLIPLAELSPEQRAKIEATEGGTAAVVNKDGYVTARDSKGRFVKGGAGNPKGKVPGTRNWIQELKRNTESALRAFLDGPDNRDSAMIALARVFEIAKNGSDKEALAAIKIINGMMLNSESTRRQPEQKTDEKKRPIQINIVNNPASHAGSPITVIEGELDEDE